MTQTSTPTPPPNGGVLGTLQPVAGPVGPGVTVDSTATPTPTVAIPESTGDSGPDGFDFFTLTSGILGEFGLWAVLLGLLFGNFLFYLCVLRNCL